MYFLHLNFIQLRISLFFFFTFIAFLLFEDITSPPYLIFANADGTVDKTPKKDNSQSQKTNTVDGSKEHLQTLALDELGPSTAAERVIKEINRSVRTHY